MATSAGPPPSSSNTKEEVPSLAEKQIAVGGDSSESYTFLNAIGKGGYADVYKVHSRAGDTYACKAIPKSRLTSTSKQNKVRMEIAIHKSLEHEHIVRFINTFEDDTFIFIILEHCQHRSMNILIKQRTKLTDPEVRYFLVQVIDALAFLHNKKIIHRDLKAGNILLKGQSQLVVKLCDFGLSALLSSDAERRRTMCGTPNYIAPEILQSAGHSYEADIWSLACLMYALIVGRPPFQTRPIREIYSRVVQGKYKASYIPDKHGRDLIKSTLVTEPDKRPKLSAFRNHEYFSEWTPSNIGLDVYDECPQHVREHIQEHKASETGTDRGRGSKGGTATSSTGQTGHLRNYVLTNSQAGAKITNFVLKGDRKPSMEYLTLITNMTSENAPPNENVVLNYEEMNDDGIKLTKEIDKCLKNFRSTNSLRHISQMDYALIWAIKWVDYSDTNQGFGYQLSDGSYGVLFQNETKMMLLADGETVFFLTRRGGQESAPNERIMQELRTCRGRLEVFVNYMTNNLVGFNIEELKNRFPKRTISDQPFPITWTRGWDEFNEHDRDYLIIIVIRPAVYQINFEDHSKVIIDYNHGKPVIMYQKDGAIVLLTELETMAQMGYTEDLHRKLRIAHENFRRLTATPPI